MTSFYEEFAGIYRLRVPFERIYTSVFLIETQEGAVLVDCATTAFDVDEYIVPALREINYRLSDLKMLILTHKHGDHAGGLERVLFHAPNLEVVRNVQEIFDGICTYPMAGHTEDCIGILDTRTGTLISGDGLQGLGVDKYRCSTQNRDAYIETVNRVRHDPRVKNILFSHAYEPWNSDRATGENQVRSCLEACLPY